jgi:hypothetical protein
VGENVGGSVTDPTLDTMKNTTNNKSNKNPFIVIFSRVLLPNSSEQPAADN